jgi:glutamyl-tRNA reductase
VQQLDRIVARAWSLKTSPAEDVERAARAFCAAPGLAVVATCTRVEVYSADERAFDRCDIPAAALSAWQALEHLAIVAAGADSLVVGEIDVLAQVRAAFADTTGVLRAFGDAAIAAGREARLSVDVDARNAGLQLDLALRHAGADAPERMCIAGAGAMAGHLARRARALGVGDVRMFSRHHSRAIAAAFAADAVAAPVEELAAAASGACLVLAFKGEPAPAMRSAVVDAARASGLIIDLTMPRFAWPADVSPRVTDLAGLMRGDVLSPAELYLREQLAVAATAAARRQWAHDHGDGAAAAQQLYRHVEDVRRAEIQRAGALDPRERQLLDNVTKALVKRLFHTYGKALRAGDETSIIDATHRLFLGVAD